MEKCIYCKVDIGHDNVIDVCKSCGIGVWGEKMFNSIIYSMKKEKEKGNMELGRVGERVCDRTKTTVNIDEIIEMERNCVGGEPGSIQEIVPESIQEIEIPSAEQSFIEEKNSYF